MNPLTQIQQNNKTHAITNQELIPLVKKAQQIYQSNFTSDVWFERSVFTNWTCAIADCKYCYLSTKPKHNPQEKVKALRSNASILAETLICKLLGHRVGYITGGLRVESTEQLISLLNKIEIVLNQKVMMNYGPYSHKVVQQLKPHLSGMGSAIESFDEELHNFICPSKPLKALTNFLGYLQEEQLQSLITIILGIGEKKSDVNLVIQNIKKYNITKIQLCFLKPQENTIFNDVPSPDPKYMAYWIAKIRIACPNVIIKIALVKDRIKDTSLYLQAGANAFSRFMLFNDFATPFAKELEQECTKANRSLQGHFTSLPKINLKQEVNSLNLPQDLKEQILPKAQQYYKKLERKLTSNPTHHE